jgi:hypothetical protein
MPWVDPALPVPIPVPTVSYPSLSNTIPAAPCIDAPFRLDAKGRIATVPAGSQDEIDAQIYNVLVCPQGAKLGDPDFGLPSPLGQSLPLNLTDLIKAIQDQVPAAVDVTAVESAILATRPQATSVTVTAQVITSA